MILTVNHLHYFSLGCNLNGDVSKNLLELRFDQDRDFKCMRQLLQKGADVNAKDNYDYTPIMYAAKGASNKALNAVRYLVSKGAQLNAKNYYSTNALHFAGMELNVLFFSLFQIVSLSSKKTKKVMSFVKKTLPF